MHRSSPSIASLAAALAKAQAELVNPEKSLTATIRSDERGRTDQSVPLCPVVERPRHCAQDLGPARDCNGADDRDRSGCRRRQSDDRAWRMRRENGSPRIGRSAQLPILPPHAGWGRH